MKKIKLKITGMHCSSCALNIDFDLEDLEGVKTSATNYIKEICEVEYDEKKIDLNKILDTIKKTGYSAIILLDS